MMPADLPVGFRAGASGLILPVETSRRRRTLTWAEWRALEKAMALFTEDRLAAEVVMRCKYPSCPDRKIERVRGGHGIILRCGCCDRSFEKAL